MSFVLLRERPLCVLIHSVLHNFDKIAEALAVSRAEARLLALEVLNELSSKQKSAQRGGRAKG